MALLFDGATGRIAELWGEVPSRRVSNWLWMRLKFFRNGPPVSFPYSSVGPIKSPGQFLGGDIELELEKFLTQHASSIPAIKLEMMFIQPAEFSWIVESNVRQLLWLVDQVHKAVDCDFPEARVRLGDRDYLICLFDLAVVPVLDKQTDISRLHHMWMAHLKTTAYLKWFNEDDETDRCDFAWEALESRLNANSLDPRQLNASVRLHYQKYRGSAGLKCYFDSLDVSDYEKKSHVEHVKKLWSQKKIPDKIGEKQGSAEKFCFI